MWNLNIWMIFFAFVDANEEEVREIFQDCGAIENVRIVRDKELGSGKGFGYVNFEVTVVFILIFIFSLSFSLSLLQFGPDFFVPQSPLPFISVFLNFSLIYQFLLLNSILVFSPSHIFSLLRSMFPMNLYEKKLIMLYELFL